MKFSRSFQRWCVFTRFAAGALLLIAPVKNTALGQGPGSNSVYYSLIRESNFVDDCIVCGRPTLLFSLTGSFQLRLVEENVLFSSFAIENLKLEAEGASGTSYRVTGQGTYEVGGEIALIQRIFLETHVDDGVTNRLALFTGESIGTDRPFPMLHFQLQQTNGTFLQTFNMEIFAAPFREMWFSTVAGMSSANSNPPTNRISDGDLLSSAGRIVERNSALVAQLGIMPVVPDLGLDAVHILPGGEIIFSIPHDEFSETLGPLQEGDVLSAHGRVVHRNQDLLSLFGVMPSVPDVGLDALQVLEDGEVLFSIREPIFSKNLGSTLNGGDVLSNRGQVLRRHQELIARFQPTEIEQDYGLDALWVWPSGEIWFSTEKDFHDAGSATFRGGDVLSDRGYVVRKNSEFVRPFAPIEDLGDFGLDSLYIITDLQQAARPHLTQIRVDHPTGDVAIEWMGSGHVFQLERSSSLTGPYEPRGAIQVEQAKTDYGAQRQGSNAFYRVRQW